MVHEILLSEIKLVSERVEHMKRWKTPTRCSNYITHHPCPIGLCSPSASILPHPFSVRELKPRLLSQSRRCFRCPCPQAPSLPSFRRNPLPRVYQRPRPLDRESVGRTEQEDARCDDLAERWSAEVGLAWEQTELQGVPNLFALAALRARWCCSQAFRQHQGNCSSDVLRLVEELGKQGRYVWRGSRRHEQRIVDVTIGHR